LFFNHPFSKSHHSSALNADTTSAPTWKKSVQRGHSEGNFSAGCRMGSQRFPLSVSAAQALTRFVTVFSLKKSRAQQKVCACFLFILLHLLQKCKCFSKFFLEI